MNTQVQTDNQYFLYFYNEKRNGSYSADWQLEEQ